MDSGGAGSGGDGTDLRVVCSTHLRVGLRADEGTYSRNPNLPHMYYYVAHIDPPQTRPPPLPPPPPLCHSQASPGPLSAMSRYMRSTLAATSTSLSPSPTPASPTSPSPSTGLTSVAHNDALNPLKRQLGVWDLTSLGIGGIIGAGVYVLTGKAAALYAGPGVVLSFTLSGIACTFSALCYAELASMIPAAGSAYSFATATLGSFVGWIIGFDLILEYLMGASTVAVGWSGYMCSLLKDAGAPCSSSIAEAPFAYDIDADAWRVTDGVINIPAVLVTLAMTAIQVRGIKESATFNTIVVGIKIVVLLLFVMVGFAYINTQNWEPFVPEAKGAWRYGAGGILRGSSVLFFSFIGFDAISTAAQEAKDPQRTVPLATLISLIVCTALYIVVGLVLTGIVSYTQLDVPDPIAVALDAAGGDDLKWLRPIVKIGAILGLTSVVMVQVRRGKENASLNKTHFAFVPLLLP
jgi:APA family basic amino acid/polyamine antiporter